MASAGPAGGVAVIAPHFKKRLSGVTSTVVQLIPRQRAMGLAIAVFGPGLPEAFPHLRWRQLPALWRRPKGAGERVWHARRNVEMAAGIVLRDVLRMPLKLVFTSAAQRHHQPLTRWMIDRMDAVVATSRRSGSYLRVPHRVIMHGVDTEAFWPAATQAERRPPEGWPGRYLVGCSGRIRHQKGTDLFVDAMIALLPRHPDWTAVVTGRATPEHRAFADSLKEKVRHAGLEDRIRFVGEVDDIKPWYRRMTLYVAPSRNEGFGLTPLEAMASGAPVVASDAGAYAEMVADGTGTVVPADDGAALMQAIERYFADPAVAEAEGRAAHRHVNENFALEREASALIDIYRAVSGGGAA